MPALEAAGFHSGDTVLNCFGYHLSPAGVMFSGHLYREGEVIALAKAWQDAADPIGPPPLFAVMVGGSLLVAVGLEVAERVAADMLQVTISPVSKLHGVEVGELRLPAGDLDDLRTCRVGSCEVKLGEPALRRFRTEIDWRAPDADAAANLKAVRAALAAKPRDDFAGTVQDLARGHFGLQVDPGGGRLRQCPVQVIHDFEELPQEIALIFFCASQSIAFRPLADVFDLSRGT